ncbi:MAG: anti-sigma factor family protein [bacterium]
MKKLISCLHHRRLHRSLVLYADNELPPNELAGMHQHVEYCAACRQRLADLRACRELLQAGKTSPFIPTEQLWQRISRKTSTSSPRRLKLGEVFPSFKRRHLRWIAAAAMVIVLAVAIWKDTHDARLTFPDSAISPATAIDYGMFLDDLHREVPNGSFYKRYPAQLVKHAEAQQAIAFPLAPIAALPDSFRLDSVRVLECNGKKCIQFTCTKAGKVINIFQHALGQPWTLGRYAVARRPICNVECLLVNAKNFAAVSWQGRGSEYLAVGELTPQELGQVVQALR